MRANSKYQPQRDRRTPPHVSLAALRAATGMTLDQVLAKVGEEFPELSKTTRGHLSAIESGTRGASTQMLNALCAAYGLPEGAITTDYQPRAAKIEAA